MSSRFTPDEIRTLRYALDVYLSSPEECARRDTIDAKLAALLSDDASSDAPTPEPTNLADLAKDADAFRGALERFLIAAQRKVDEKNATYAHKPVDKLITDPGRRYVRVWVQPTASDTQTSLSRRVFCFVDKTNGDILKAATWKAPAKHARGNIFDEDGGANAVDWHGGRYLR